LKALAWSTSSDRDIRVVDDEHEVDGTYLTELQVFLQKVLEADLCLFASPDYNYSITRMVLSFYSLSSF
jgi:NAD(P)H-dependent FMN reductase